MTSKVIWRHPAVLNETDFYYYTITGTMAYKALNSNLFSQLYFKSFIQLVFATQILFSVPNYAKIMYKHAQ